MAAAAGGRGRAEEEDATAALALASYRDAETAWRRRVAVPHPLDATRVAKVALLVRHPMDAIWSEYQRRQGGGEAAGAV